MKRLAMLLFILLACSCTGQKYGPAAVDPAAQPKPKALNTPVNPYSYIEATVNIVTIPRSQHDRLAALNGYLESGGIYGPSNELLALNGLKMARGDMRFAKEFDQAVGMLQKNPGRITLLRMSEGREQTFKVGETLSEETLFVWTEPDVVMGRHFPAARYEMKLSLEKVKDKNVADLGISWLVRKELGLARTAAITPLDAHVELEPGQPLLIAPADFSGRGVGRALLGGVRESAFELTFFVITPTKIVKKTEPPATP